MKEIVKEGDVHVDIERIKISKSSKRCALR